MASETAAAIGVFLKTWLGMRIPHCLCAMKRITDICRVMTTLSLRA